jgi:hypothetical protein
VVEDAATAELRRELERMKLRALEKRATAEVEDETLLDAAMDSGDPKSALIELLLAKHTSLVTSKHDEMETRRRELQKMKLRALSKYADEVDLPDDKVDHAMDSNNPKQALVELILSVPPSLTGDCKPVEHSNSAKTQPVSVPSQNQDDMEELESAEIAQLRHELQAMRVLALYERASAEGIDEAQLEDAMDGNDPKGALIGLVLGRHRPDGTGEDEAAMRQSVRAELQTMRVAALLQRAVSDNVEPASIEDAMDSDNVKVALVELIVAQVGRGAAGGSEGKPSSGKPSSGKPSSSKPHFGNSRGTDGSKQAGLVLPSQQQSQQQEAQGRSTKHVMLSYQWDHQKQVKRVHMLLIQLGLNVWMDINGGMGTDIYESMAEGVSNASVVVCFMSQQYQESPNCMLELKFAKQSGIEVVPVMIQGGGWKASGWLGLVTAGSLWTPLHQEADFEENVRQLHGQVIKFIGETDQSDIDSLDVDWVDEAKEELERLRETQTVAQSTVSMVLADPSQPATIPAGVPKLPARFHATSEIDYLSRLVLSTSSAAMEKPRVGFYGMGGIGKTVTGAAIVRNDDVRMHFDAVVWLPIGQTPVIEKLQNLCHMQCTGRELSAELSSEEKKQALQQAMAGKKILLCLDDLWEAVHETELNFADVDAGSKVLISTRMKGLLEEAHTVEVGLPSPEDSARMMLSAADVEDVDGSMPTGVAEIVDLCGRLPLALGIAGRMAASLGLVGTQDWSGMIDVLKEELRESHSGGAEEGMIRASLRGLKGSAAEKENVKTLLLLFAIVPEDTHCPLEVLLLMFKAASPEASVSIMHIRKWLRVLIDRSLVLGTIDRPSVHDLVLDFAVAQHSAEELREKHCRVVEAFREARPMDVHGRHKYSRVLLDDPVCAYVCAEVPHHLKLGWKDDVGMAWLGDVPQDEMVIEAGRVMGVEKLREAATKADDDGDSWMAGRLWALLSMVELQSSGHLSMRHSVDKSLDSLSTFLKSMSAGQGFSSTLRDEVYEVQFYQMMALALFVDVPAMMDREDDITQVLKSKAAANDCLTACNLEMHRLGVPACVSGRVRDVGDCIAKGWAVIRPTMDNHPDPSFRYLCSLHLYNNNVVLDSVLFKEGKHDFDWHYGTNAEVYMKSVRAYDYDRAHATLRQMFNADWFLLCPMSLMPVALHFGHVAACREYAARSLTVWEQAMDEPNPQADNLGFVAGLSAWGFLLAAVPGLLAADQQAGVAALFVRLELTWDQVETNITNFHNSITRERGFKTKDKDFFSTEGWGWLVPCAFAVVTQNSSVTADKVLDFLPTVDAVIEGMCTSSACSVAHSSFGPWNNAFLLCAMLCEKYALWQEALVYCDAALDTDLKKAGCETPITRTVTLSIKGRALFALGRINDAAQALEIAAGTANRSEMWMCEALALLDLKLCVLDTMGHADHASRRLGAVLRKLTAPPELLTPMLKGLDAAELMLLPDPEVGYEVVYVVEDEGKMEELCRELGDRGRTPVPQSSTVMAPSAHSRQVEVLTAALQSGDGFDRVVEALEHGLDVLDALSVSTPRKKRWAFEDLFTQAENILRGVDERAVAQWSTVEPSKLSIIARRLCAVQALIVGTTDGADCTKVVKALLDELDPERVLRIGSATRQSNGFALSKDELGSSVVAPMSPVLVGVGITAAAMAVATIASRN